MEKRSMDGDATTGVPRRPEPLKQPIDAPPSPPPSVTPTKEKTFLEVYGIDRQAPTICASPRASSPDGLAALSESARQAASAAGDGGPKTPRLKPQRSGTLPVIPRSMQADGHSSNGTISTSHAEDDTAGPSSHSHNPPKLPVATAPVPSSSSPAPTPAALLHPSTAAVPTSRPTRRNTTGSSAPSTPRPVRNTMAAHHTHMSQQVSVPVPGPSSQGFPTYAPYEDGAQGQLDSDILKEAEQIRAERRAKAQQEAEAAMTAPQSSRRSNKAGSIDEGKPLVGNIIGEDHVNYVLMYNMLTGIRVAVSTGTVKDNIHPSDEECCVFRSHAVKRRSSIP